jgi:hypothetical protein
MFEALGFDGNFNQPGLLARDNHGASRIEHVWDRILAKVKVLERTRPFDVKSPITMLIKETLNTVRCTLSFLSFSALAFSVR